MAEAKERDEQSRAQLRADLERLLSESMRGGFDAVVNGLRIAQAVTKIGVGSAVKSPQQAASVFMRLSAEAASIVNRHARDAVVELLHVIDRAPSGQAEVGTVKMSATPGSVARGAFVLANTSGKPFAARFVMSDLTSAGAEALSGMDCRFSPPTTNLDAAAETQVLVEFAVPQSARAGFIYAGAVRLAGQPSYHVPIQLHVLPPSGAREPARQADAPANSDAQPSDKPSKKKRRRRKGGKGRVG